MNKIQKCPSCGSEKFVCKIMHIGVANITKDGDKSYFNILEESDQSTSFLAACINPNCKYNGKDKNLKLTLEDLVSKQKCTKCGNEYDSEELDENGVCPLCLAMDRDDLKNASKEDLIRKILQMERGNSPISNVEQKINNKIEKSKEVIEKAEVKLEEQAAKKENSAEDMTEAIEKKNAILAKADEAAVEKVEAAEVTEKPKAKRQVRNKKADPSTTPEPDPISAEAETKQDENVVSEIEAPFPDFSDSPNPAINPPTPETPPRFDMFGTGSSGGGPSAF